MNRLLMILYEGAPLAWFTTRGEVCERIAKFGEASAPYIQVWAVHHDDERNTRDVTAEYKDVIGRLATPKVHHLKLARAH